MTLNHVSMAGHIMERPDYHHTSHGTDLYQTTLCVTRTSGIDDLLPLMLPESLLYQLPEKGGCTTLDGQLRSFCSNGRRGSGNSKLQVYLFAHKLTFSPNCSMLNFVRLTCCLKRCSDVRVTPLGREICDVLLDAPRPFSEQRYLIPAIAWGALAHRMADLSEGALLEVTGRLQSRDYVKQLPEGPQQCVTYELSLVDVVAKSLCT